MIGAMLFMSVAGYIPTGKLPFKVVPEFWSWLILSLLIFLFYNLLLPRRRTPGTTTILSLILSAASLVITSLFVHIFSSMPNYALVYGSLAASDSVPALAQLQHGPDTPGRPFHPPLGSEGKASP